ncbi:MAG: bacteriohopanetetrol glucosamine biosynthesis glycosyltransferase HpnI [Blastocatellia bacterium]|nr:bacteriohopanetetrol glucosamine biosynthesis glycosyltransferase HpnI [Blastocatellia bacterium]
MNLVLFILFWLLFLLVIASGIYHLLSLYCGWLFFQKTTKPTLEFTPPISVLKPLRGGDNQTYQCLASFCQQDYFQYEIIFGVLDEKDPAIELVKKLQIEFPNKDIKLVINSRRIGTSAKVSNLANILLVATYDTLVISDSDVYANPDYLRTIIFPLSDERIGLVTSLYSATHANNFSALMEAIALMGEFALGVLTARQLDGVKFAFGPSIATRKSVLTEFGGFEAIANRLGDDFLLGNLTASLGYQVYLSPYLVKINIPDYKFWDMFLHQLRWARSTKFRRPLGYIGLLFTFSTMLSILLILVAPLSLLTWVAVIFALLARFLAAWYIGIRKYQDDILRKYFYLLPIRDILSFIIWVTSFLSNKVIWCGDTYKLQHGGKLTLVKKAQ